MTTATSFQVPVVGTIESETGRIVYRDAPAVLDWHGLYGDGWKNEIVPDAFTHPAKYSRALIRHIYEYLMREGYLREGDTVLDPFGGVALGGLDAMRLGLHWVGCELEQKFVRLGAGYDCPGYDKYFRRWYRKHHVSIAHLCPDCERSMKEPHGKAAATVAVPPHRFIGNIDLWNRRYAGHLPRWGSARLLQGDSRQLAATIAAANSLVSSPPYSVDALGHKGGEGPKAAGKTRPDYERARARVGFESYYGMTGGNLGNLREGDFAAAVSSPPYSEARIGQESGQEHFGHHDQYGESAGQLGAMRGNGYDAAVSSPPYEHRSYEGLSGSFAEWREMQGRSNDRPGVIGIKEGYGKTEGQMAGSDDFWHAARTVVEQTHHILCPGAVAVWVVKAFVRNKAIVPFPEQWQRLCEAVGFRTIAVARAWLVEDHGTQYAMDGNHKRRRTERKSFFRRLAEKNGSPRIDYETVLIMRKAS